MVQNSSVIMFKRTMRTVGGECNAVIGIRNNNRCIGAVGIKIDSIS